MSVHKGELKPVPRWDRSKYLYEPSQWGKTFHALKCREAMGAGAAGPGKTTVLLNDDWDQILVEHERCRQRTHTYHIAWGESTGWALHLRRTVKMLEQTIVKSFRIFPHVDPGAKFDKQKNTWLFSSGYRYQFGHCVDSNTWEDYMSFEFTAIFFDELIQFEEQQYQNIEGRLRSTDPVLMNMLKCRAMSNPRQHQDGEEKFSFKGNPNWVREYYIDPAPEGKRYLLRKIVHPDGEVEIRKRLYLPATLDDNPDKAFVRQYRGTLLTKPKQMQEALLYGNWYITAGSYFGDVWQRQLHICDAFKVPADWPVWRSMDWGFKAPGCIHWYTMDEDGNVYVIAELTFQGKTVDQVAAELKVIETSMGCWKDKSSLLTGPADTQLWEQRGSGGKGMAQLFLEKGIHWKRAIKGNQSRKTDAQRMHKMLSDHHQGTTTPGLVFFRNCRDAIRTIPSIQTAEDRETPVDGGEDHWFDSVRYGTRYSSRGRASIGAPPIELVEEEETADEDASTVNRGRLGYG